MPSCHWPSLRYNNRPSYTATSSHQTLVGKALYEHAIDCGTVAAVASVSPIIRNSSLGPNLLGLCEIISANVDLFSDVFSPSNTLQFTRRLKVHVVNSTFRKHLENKLLPLFQALRNSRYFDIDELHLVGLSMESCGGLIRHCAPRLKELVLQKVESTDSPSYFLLLGNLADEFSNLTRLTVDHNTNDHQRSEFQNIFCGRLLAKNRLKYLSLQNFRLDSEDWQAIANANADTLEYLKTWGTVFASHVGSSSFKNLKVWPGQSTIPTDNLAQLGSSCSNLDELLLFNDQYKILSDANSGLAPEAFGAVRKLSITTVVNHIRVESSLDRLRSLEELRLNVSHFLPSSLLEQLPSSVSLKHLNVTFPGNLNSRCAESNEFLRILSSSPKCAHLQTLQISLMSSDISNFENFELLGGLKNLKHLTLSPIKKPERLVKIVQSLPQLEYLCVTSISFTASHVVEILHHTRDPTALKRIYLNGVFDATGNFNQDLHGSKLQQFAFKHFPQVELNCQHIKGENDEVSLSVNNNDNEKSGTRRKRN